MAVVVKTVLGSHFGVGEFTTQFRTNFSGWIESDVQWGYAGLSRDGMSREHARAQGSGAGMKARDDGR